ncbi:MAG TPA: heparinase II/III family protein, partial [Bryobacteraceae bacterium]
VYADGLPAIIDVGVETYTAKTFGPRRYEIWTMQSAFHNCPTIDGVMQSAGRAFRASDVRYRATDDAAELRLNLAAAYPPEAHLDAWNRTLRLNRAKNEIELLDEFVLRQSARNITLTLMTPCIVNTGTPGELSLTVSSGKPVRILYDRALSPSVEEIRLEDARLRGTWGDRLFRILLRAEAPAAKGAWTMRISQ